MATIIFDFDDTLFNTKKLKEDIFSELVSHGIDRIIIKKTYKECRDNYCISKHIEILKRNNLHVPNSFLSWFSSFNLKNYLFPTTIRNLEKLSKNNYLVLLTKGDLEFQDIKIKGSKISKYFKEIHITQKNKEEFLKNKRYSYPVYFINDKELENKKIKKAFPKIIIKQKKGEAISAISFLGRA